MIDKFKEKRVKDIYRILGKIYFFNINQKMTMSKRRLEEEEKIENKKQKKKQILKEFVFLKFLKLKLM